MPNPGSPQAMRDSMQQQPFSSRTMIGMLIAMVIMMVVMMFRQPIGYALDFVFRYIAFDGQYPALTLIIAGVLMITITTVIRSLISDPIKMAKNQQIQSDFNKELRQARQENNLFKMKKLQEIQPQIMAANMETTNDQMKIMPVTMIIILPVYAWVWYFLMTGDGAVYFSAATPPLIDIPWAFDWNLNNYIWFMPSWIIVYTLISLPIGQAENRIIRYLFLRKHYQSLDK